MTTIFGVLGVFLVLQTPSRRIRLVPVFILETNNQTNNECLPKFVLTDNASSSIKTANNNKNLPFFTLGLIVFILCKILNVLMEEFSF